MKRIIFILCLSSTFFCAHSKCNKNISSIKKDSAFKDWEFTPNSVIGFIYISNTKHRKYFTIKEESNQTTWVYEYDPANILVNTTKIEFLNGKILLITEVNRWNQVTDSTYYDYIKNDEYLVTSLHDGVNIFWPCKKAKYIFKEGLLTEINYLNDSGKLYNNSNGYAIVRYKRYADKFRFGLEKEASFFDLNNNAVYTRQYECHKLELEYDENRNRVSRATLGINNLPALNRYGRYKEIDEYDKDGNGIRATGYDSTGNLAKNVFGIAIIEWKYENGFLIGQIHYDENKKIVRSATVVDSLAIIESKYDVMGNQIEKDYFDENKKLINDGKGICKIKNSYSSNNLITSIEYFDKDDSPAVDERNIHYYKLEYDEKGRLIKKEYFDKNNAVATDNFDQVEVVKFSYDNWGRKTRESYWENDSLPMNRWNGFQTEKISYNAQGKWIEISYFDKDGKFTVGTTGYSRQVVDYNENGQISIREYFDGKTPIVQSEGYVSNYHSIKYNYDVSNRVASLIYCDVNDNPTIARIELSSDNVVSCTKVIFLYKGNRISGEKFYVENNENPAIELETSESKYISSNGINVLQKTNINN